MNKIHKIGVIGAGYVGMATALSLARKNHCMVYLHDKSSEVMEQLNSGKCPINERGMQDALHSRIKKDVIKVVNNVRSMMDAEVIYICVGTPTTRKGELDMSYLLAVIDRLTDLCYEGVIAIKSTINVGMTDLIASKLDNPTVFIPEFLREGTALADALNPSRIIIGYASNFFDKVDPHKVVELLHDIYKYFCYCKVLEMSATSAELVKLASNSYLAVRVSYFNELQMIANEIEGANIDHIIEGMSFDPRIGNYYNTPGVGYGGPCLPKDTKSMVKIAKTCGCRMRTLEGAVQTNEDVFDNWVDCINGVIKDTAATNILFMGTAFKSGSEDSRNSILIKLVDEIKSRKRNIVVANEESEIDFSINYDLIIVGTTKLIPSILMVQCSSGNVIDLTHKLKESDLTNGYTIMTMGKEAHYIE